MAKKHPLPVDGASASAGDADSNKTRGLHIFSHFGIPKQVNLVVVGNVHPTIIRLGVQFSSFKICGANARCIATLTAFKSVRMPLSSDSSNCNDGERRSFKTTKPHPMRHFRDTL
jgi:hypothetical protein